MTEGDLTEIESKLSVVLPEKYRDLMLARAEILRSSGCFNSELSRFFLERDKIIRFNIMERLSDSGTGDAFPNWWEEFLLVGTNGAGDYFCTRLDNKPGLWMIGSDCGDQPSLIADSLPAFIDDSVQEHQKEQERAEKRQSVIQEEVTAELRAISAISDPRAKQWLESLSPYPMIEGLRNLGYEVSARKMRLLGIACCQRLKDLPKDDDCVRAVRLAEQMVAGVAAIDEVASLRSHLKKKYLAIVKGEMHSPAGLWCVGAAKNLLQEDVDYLKKAPVYAGDANLSRVWDAANSATFCNELESYADLWREVLGNPFHPVKFAPRWRTEAAMELAREIYESQAFDRMAILADAIANAGCNDQRILAHCHRSAGHVRGCWVLDLILQIEADSKE
ncbi:MAG: SMI1/KNR4 family protein [Pirellulaceae bacterium]